MKKFILTIIIISSLLFLGSCSSTSSDNTTLNTTTLNTTSQSETSATTSQYKIITSEEAYNIMQSGDKYILLDVRTEAEYDAERIDGAILIPDTEIMQRAEKELPDKNALILVYCRSGIRAANASNELVDLGYTNVQDFGGIIDWPYATVKS